MSPPYPPAVKLRFPDMNDAEQIAEGIRESFPEIGRWMSWAKPDHSPVQMTEWIKEQSAARENGSAYEFLVVDEGDHFLGICGINQINRPHRFANLGYWVRSSEWGRGIAVEAVQQVKLWGFAELRLRRLELVIALGNTRSERVAEKVGAAREGVSRARLVIHDRSVDATMFSLISAEAH